MRYKDGLILYNMHEEVDKILKDDGPLDEIFQKYARRDCFITSARDGEHMLKSLHYRGRAVDARANDLPDGVRVQIDNALWHSEAFKGFDIVRHGVGANNHWHIEWDPK